MPYSIKTDRKWQKRWADGGLYKFNRERLDKKLYCLEMFSYPSAANLHVGHWYNFGLTDSYARFKRMQGFEVFHPMGFDAFGLPAENYAISTGVHPQDSTRANIAAMRVQLQEMGATFDWDYTLATCEPEYYKWNQWLFLKLYERGLAYRGLAPVNWCPRCQTVLANEQVIDGQCERCSAEVTKKNLTQWFFKITDYAQELLDFLPDMNWPEKTKKIQQNWIGRSEGAEIEFQISGSELKFKVFTTRADTLYGATYAAFAPENPLVDEITVPERREQVEKYREDAKKQSEIERMSTTREKTGVPTGSYAINPVNGKLIPIWVADYVLAGYGTGCVMAVPGHDARDYDFAQKYGLPIVRVVTPVPGAAPGTETSPDAEISQADGAAPDRDGGGNLENLPYTDDGTLVNSECFNGLTGEEARRGIVDMLKAEGKAEFRVNYKLRDWLVSRQRYWGTPIPIVHCENCGAVPVPESELPVLLPYNVEFTPDGESPLKKSAEYMNTACPKCGGPARRDPDTLDTFVCSSWYYLRYLDNKNPDRPFDPGWIDSMAPVDIYVGGPEHAAMHLLYARFVTKALRDMGYLHFDEPFARLVHQGMILGADGFKMSKSLGNTVSPDEYILKYGSDAFRIYLGFGFAYTEGGPWNDGGIKAASRFLARAERLSEKISDYSVLRGVTAADIYKDMAGASNPIFANYEGNSEKELQYAANYAIKSAGADIERIQFNTSISRSMELLNALYKYDAEVADGDKSPELFIGVYTAFIRLIAPFAPHFCEERWEAAGLPYSIFSPETWPQYSEAALKKDFVEMAVQVNGIVRFRLDVPRDASDSDIETAVKNDGRLPAFLTAAGKNGAQAEILKIIIVRGRLISIVAK